ncbi:MAG: ribosome-associated translation inhibitor RaiA [Bacteroidota bacterium]|nr:ribosome-associated translation inhibitor RaiA [Bacteroidota bacterium]
MKVNLNAVGFSVDKKLVEFIQVKLDKVERFYDRIIDADVYLKVENTSDKENKIVEIRVNVPGNDIAVSKQAKSFEEAVDNCCDALERSLLKHKEKERK